MQQGCSDDELLLIQDPPQTERENTHSLLTYSYLLPRQPDRAQAHSQKKGQTQQKRKRQLRRGRGKERQLFCFGKLRQLGLLLLAPSFVPLGQILSFLSHVRDKEEREASCENAS